MFETIFLQIKLVLNLYGFEWEWFGSHSSTAATKPNSKWPEFYN